MLTLDLSVGRVTACEQTLHDLSAHLVYVLLYVATAGGSSERRS